MFSLYAAHEHNIQAKHELSEKRKEDKCKMVKGGVTKRLIKCTKQKHCYINAVTKQKHCYTQIRP